MWAWSMESSGRSSALVLVPVTADGEATLVPGDEGLAIGSEADVMAANLAHLPILLVQQLWLQQIRAEIKLPSTAGEAGEARGAGTMYP